MKVIMLQDVIDIGKQREIVNVKSGYASNFLFPKGLAAPANDANMKKLDAELAQIARIEAEIKANAEQVKATINGKTVTITSKAGPDGRLYGAITSKDVTKVIQNNLKVDVDKRKVECDNIKQAGTYEVKVKLHPQVDAQIYVVVKPIV